VEAKGPARKSSRGSGGVGVLLINGAIGQARVISVGLDGNTLLIGDHLIMSRIGYDAGIPFTNLHVPLWRNPKRQQIIIFKPPFDPTQPDYVNARSDCRAIRSIFMTMRLWIKRGQRLAENYTLGKTERVETSEIKMPYKVPEELLFRNGR